MAKWKCLGQQQTPLKPKPHSSRWPRRAPKSTAWMDGALNESSSSGDWQTRSSSVFLSLSACGHRDFLLWWINQGAHLLDSAQPPNETKLFSTFKTPRWKGIVFFFSSGLQLGLFKHYTLCKCAEWLCFRYTMWWEILDLWYPVESGLALRRQHPAQGCNGDGLRNADHCWPLWAQDVR